MEPQQSQVMNLELFRRFNWAFSLYLLVRLCALALTYLKSSSFTMTLCVKME